MNSHSPSYPSLHPFGETPRNLPKAAILLQVYLLYFLLSALFLGFLWVICSCFVDEPFAAAVFSLILGGPFVLFFSLAPHRFALVYYPASAEGKVFHFIAALWFGITGGGAVPLTNWLGNNLGKWCLSFHEASEKNRFRGLCERSSLSNDFKRETPVD